MNDGSSAADQAAETEPAGAASETEAVCSVTAGAEIAGADGVAAETTTAETPCASDDGDEIRVSAPERRSRAQIQTARLDSREIRPSWPTAIASLEQLSGWAVLALRLGTLALIQQCVRELAEQHARADLIVRLRTLTDALAHMPLET